MSGRQDPHPGRTLPFQCGVSVRVVGRCGKPQRTVSCIVGQIALKE